MDPVILSKIGNVTIQRLPLKQDDTDITNENAAVEHHPSVPVPLPKLPSSIDITIKSVSNTSNLNPSEKEQSPQAVELQESQPAIHDSNSNSSEKSEIEGSRCTEHVDLGNYENEICDKLENAQDNNSLEIDSEHVLPERVNLEGLAAVEILKSAEIIEELPNIKEEFIDDEEFRRTEINNSEETSGVLFDDDRVKNEATENMPCEEEDCSNDKKDSESEESESDGADDEHDDDQSQENATRKKKRKSKNENDIKDSKKQRTSQEEKMSDSEEKEKTSELKVGNLRKNIREVMDETKLDEATLAAQMQEKERLRRVQEQLRANRDIQRQARVISRFEKTLGGSIKEEATEQLCVDKQKPNTVVVKLTTGSSNQMLDMLKKHNSSSASEDEDASLEKYTNLSKNLNKPQMMTASVSIAPVKNELKSQEILEVVDDEALEDKTKGKDIVMISSDEDDCIVISEGEESEPEVDTANSGMHTNDLYNVPDAQGRVLINVGHPETEKEVFLAPQIARIIKPHQIGGVRFLFDNIVESLDRYRTSEGFGCILAHSMGLGKTLQVISFSDVFLRYTEGRTILCIMPINTLQNWVAEFNMWLPVDPDTSHLKEQGEVLGRQFPLFVLNDNQKTLTARANVISQWYKEGGILLIGYELYRQLSLKKPPKSRTRSKKRIAVDDVVDEKSKTLLEVMYNALVKPGPDLVICDEGHRIKNSHASISQALKQIRSKRRVVLTGYPLQNNLLEYWCMVDFVRPNYLGTKTEFSNMFERPIQNGQCIDSTPQDVKLMRYRAHVLHSLLEGFVQRRSHSVLQQTLPTKYEFVILLRLTPFQRQLYNTFMNEVVRTKAVPNPLKAFAVCCKIWNHPDILYNFLKKRAGEEDIDLDLEETASSTGASASGPSTPMTPSTPPQPSINKRGRNRLTKRSQNKVPRKNTRTNTSQPVNETPLNAAASTNTPNNSKPSLSEQISQPIQPFNTFNNSSSNKSNDNTISNFNRSSGNAINVAYSANQPDNSNHASQNLANQYSQQTQPQQNFNLPTSVANVDYSADINFRQTFNEGNYFQSEFSPNNYWQENNMESGGGSSNDGSNILTSASNDDYYQNASQVGQQQYTSGNNFCSTSSESNTPPDYNNQTYNFDLNRQQHMYSNATGGVNVKNEFVMMNENMFEDNVSYEAELNRNQMNEPKSNVMPFGNAAQATTVNFDSALFQNQQQQIRTKRPGRPAVSQREVVGMNPRSGVVGRKRNGDFGLGDATASNPDAVTFKPGLLGGAPILKTDGQNYSLNDNEGENTLANPMSSSFNLDSINNDELWNPSRTDQNNVFNDQTFMFSDNQGPNTNQGNFMQNDGLNLPGGSRGPRNLLNEIQNNEIFNPGTCQQSEYLQMPENQNLFIDNYHNYLNDIQIPTQQSSFMGLLQEEEALNAHAGTTQQNSLKAANKKIVNESSKSAASPTPQTQIPLPSMNVFSTTHGANAYSYQNENRSANTTDQQNPIGWSTFKDDGTQDSLNKAGGLATSFENERLMQVNTNLNESLIKRFETNRNVSLISISDQKNINEKQKNETDTVNQAPIGSLQQISSMLTMKPNEHTNKNFIPQSKGELPSETSRSFTSMAKQMMTMTSATCKNSLNDDTSADTKMPAPEVPLVKPGRDTEPGIPYEWTNEFFKNYEPGRLEASAKMLIFFSMLEETIKLNDRLLLFSQSLFTLDLIEDFLQMYNIPGTDQKWARNKSYFRLDGSTTALEREKLINEFNSNSNIHLFLVSTRAGSLGINLVGANRVVVFDASWNPCHDTQAVCRVYRYGQQKCCYVYRFVIDNSLEKKIYDRQINKQGMSDRIVDECNPEAHLTMKDVSSLCWDADDVPESKKDFSDCVDKYDDVVIKKVIQKYGSYLSREPFIHESLLIDRKDTKLSQAEKRMAKRGYELEKQANSRPSYGGYYGNSQITNNRLNKPMTSVQPLIAEHAAHREPLRRWIPAEVWKKQGMGAQEMSLPFDIEIPTNSADSSSNIVLQAGQRVMVLRSHKGIYMQLENGKIVAIKTQLKPNQTGIGAAGDKKVGNYLSPRNNLVTPMPSGPMPNPLRLLSRPTNVDCNLGSLGNKKDLTISPIRNRFIRPNQSSHSQMLSSMAGSPHGMLRSHLSNSRLINRQPNLVQRSYSNLGRSSPQSQRQQTQLPSPPTSVGGKSLFGPNSAVTLSVSNNKKLEQLIPNQDKDRTSRLIEVDYGDYSPNRGLQYSDFASPSNDLQTSRNMQYSTEAIPEALRHKKDINLTPMRAKPVPISQKQSPSYQQPIPGGKVRIPSMYTSAGKNANHQISSESVKNSLSPSPSLLKTGSAISIFPVSNKTEENNAQGYEQNSYQQQQPKNSSYYSAFASENAQSSAQASQQQKYQQRYQDNSSPYFSPGFNQQSPQSYSTYSNSGGDFNAGSYGDGGQFGNAAFTSSGASQSSQGSSNYGQYDSTSFYNNYGGQQTAKGNSLQPPPSH